MRKLMWFTIGFTVACAIGIYAFCGNWLVLLSLIAFAGVALSFAGDKTLLRRIRLILLGCGVAFLWVWLFHGMYLVNLDSVDGTKQTAIVEISQYSESTDWGIRADGKLALEGKYYNIRIYATDLKSLSPGDRVEGEFRFQASALLGQERTYHSSDGIFLLGYLEEGGTVFRADHVRIRYLPAILRQKILTILNRAFPEDTLGFARALLLGDRTELDYSVRSDLSVSGIRHVVAVSGLHVSILFNLVFLIFGYRRIVTPVIGWIMILLFAAITGFTPSVVRAGIMHALILGSMMLQREYDPPTALSFAVLSMLTVNPMAVTSIGLQLSAGCLVGIFLFSGPIRSFLLSDSFLGPAKPKTLAGKLKNWFAGSVGITLGTWITTTPLCVLYFGTVSLIGLLTNLVTLWLISFIFCGILLSCLLGVFWPGAAGVAAWIVSWPIRMVLGTAKVFASFPLAAVYTKSVYIVIWIIFCYVLAAAFLIMKKKQPWVLVCCIILSLVGAIAASWMEPRMDDYRVTMLDVGQGQSIIIQNNDKYYLVDCGGDNDESAADTTLHTLLSQGVTRLDGVIVTHYDDDHAAGVTHLLSRISTDVLYLPDIQDTTDNRRTLEALGGDHCVIVPCEATMSVADSGITLITTGTEKSDNESSMCVLFQRENCAILITGDRGEKGERKLLESADIPDLTVLVVGHHGAKGVASLPLLTQTKPELALISLSEDNPYNHPAADVLARLELFDVQILRTDHHGTITIRG